MTTRNIQDLRKQVAAPERIWTVNESPADEICWRDNVFFTDKDASAVGWDVGKLVEYTRADLADRIEELEAKLAKAVEALSGVMVGGNHLALLLPDNFLPAETEPLDALDMMGAGDAYEVWCCWRTIMLARTALAELTGGGQNE